MRMFAYVLPLNIIYVGLVRWEIVVLYIQVTLLILNKKLGLLTSKDKLLSLGLCNLNIQSH